MKTNEELRKALSREFTGINRKTSKLWRFMQTPSFERLDQEDKQLLSDQYAGMRKYNNTLAERLKKAEARDD
jgi:spore coat protein CotF